MPKTELKRFSDHENAFGEYLAARAVGCNSQKWVYKRLFRYLADNDRGCDECGKDALALALWQIYQDGIQISSAEPIFE